jgi:hypothetical protein
MPTNEVSRRLLAPLRASGDDLARVDAQVDLARAIVSVAH